ncbi:MAG: GAF and ANTAR domain-containing protein [Actinobacteria bacterium]|nr:GAF and ANTAR domain-containing protein [Actinomycetota bacterium]
MATDRRLRIVSRVVAIDGSSLEARRLCEVSAEITATSGAGIMLIAGGASRGSVCTSDSVSDQLEDLQFTLGEGPCIDACRDGRAVLEPDLVNPATSRWIAFGPPAIMAGARAVFGFPIRVGAVSLGALNLYRDRPGPLTEEQHADALVLADVAAEVILLLQANASPGELAAELESSASFHYVVHQASGMVSAQLEVSVDHALVRLRAHAFGSGVPLLDVARSVVDRTLRFDPVTGLGTDR